MPANTEQAEEIFETFELGAELDFRLGEADQQEVRKLLVDVFMAFAKDGAWDLFTKDALTWDTDTSRSERDLAMFPVHLPVQVVLSPADITTAYEGQLNSGSPDEDEFREECEALLASIPKWRAALDEAERLIRERMPEKG